ncbi:gamma-glutamyltranspeptidase [Pseudovirgaria hyperparasitica]|uniref:Glutathione hydrolase n=1 Tax=Pseudovirgaria hyperparasitica TaxID=470096 RepID=A0A6A6VRK6_9PEZI|nr:gamma-glutamyltranspeptidase [Pseudovirgaria hyperparasitica]KAF2752833.1 gamma-glutamyltranspeptidase [Pseudovirgaria hyperparasitica]
MAPPRTLYVALLLSPVFANPTLYGQRSDYSPYYHGQAHESTIGAVSCESDICARIGTSFLKDGSNAADALVATVFCVGVVGMYHSGVGGGGFGLIRKPDSLCTSEKERFEFVDFRETAPAAAYEDMYKDNSNGSVYGGLASGVPGEVRGLQHIYENYGSGKFSWAELMAPAIAVARLGWRVNEDLISYMASAVASGSTGDFLVHNAEFAKDFAPNGTRLQLNQTITRARYANTLEKIANGGPNAFYEGELAEAMITTLQSCNGTMTLDDLKNYTVAVRNITQIDYRGYKVSSIGAPGGGPVALAALNILQQYEAVGEAGLNITTHRLDEAMKFAYGMRTELGDPLFLADMDEYVQDMISNDLALAVKGRISDSHTLNASAYDPKGLEILNTPGTSHINVADASGMAISLTTTINLLFGSQVVVPESGIIMNDEMNDFSIPNVTNAFGYIPSPANYVRPGKRPLSSMSPVIVEFPNGTLYLVVGAAGGSRITTATIQNIWNVLDRNMTTLQALKEPRLHDQLIPLTTSFEFTYSNDTVDYMREKGHNITFVAPGGSTAQALRRLGNGTFEAAGEPRQMNSGGFAV